MCHPLISVFPNRRDNITFRHDFDLIPQPGGGLQRRTKHRLRPVGAIDISLIHRGDTLRQTGLDLRLHMPGGRIIVIPQPPHAIDDAGHSDPTQGYAIHHRLSPTPSGVCGAEVGTRP